MASSSSSTPAATPGLAAYRQLMTYKSASSLAVLDKSSVPSIIKEERTGHAHTVSTELPPFAHISENSLEDELDNIISSIPVRGKTGELSWNCDSDSEDDGGLLLKRTTLGKSVCVSITDRPAEPRSPAKATTVTTPKATGQKIGMGKSVASDCSARLSTDVEQKTAGGASFLVRRVSAPDIIFQSRPAEPRSPRSPSAPMNAKTGQKVTYIKSKTTEKLEANLNADIESGACAHNFVRRVSAPEISASSGSAAAMTRAKTTCQKTTGQKVTYRMSKSFESAEANLNTDMESKVSSDFSFFVRRVSCPEVSMPNSSKLLSPADTSNGVMRNRSVSLNGPVSAQQVQAAVDLHIASCIGVNRSRRPSRTFGELFRRCKEKCPSFKKNSEDGKRTVAAWDGFSNSLVPDAPTTAPPMLEVDGASSSGLDSTPRPGGMGARLSTAGRAVTSKIRGRTSSRVIQFEV